MLLIKFLLLSALWLILSDKYDLLHLSLGIISVLIAIYLHAVLFPKPVAPFKNFRLINFIMFLPWFFIELFKANFHVCYLALAPKGVSLINPRILIFSTKDLNHEGGELLLAHAITLTPGTLTLDVENKLNSDEHLFTVHAIDAQSAESVPEPMLSKVRSFFKEAL